MSHDTLVFWVEKDIRGCIYYRSYSLPFRQMLRCPFIFQISLLVEELKLLEIHMFLAANILVHSTMCLWQNLSDKNTIEGPIGCVYENLLLLYPAVHTMIPKFCVCHSTWQMDSNFSEIMFFRWSVEFGAHRNGSPELHVMLAEYIYSESPEVVGLSAKL